VRFLTEAVQTKTMRHGRKLYTDYQHTMPFETRQTEPGITVVKVAGKLVWGCRDLDLLETAVSNLLGDGQKNIVFDLSALDYADSSGLAVLIACIKHIKSSGGDLRMVEAKPRIQKLLRLARVEEMLVRCPTLAKGAGG
jgi:anti-anti-sigma factor